MTVKGSQRKKQRRVEEQKEEEAEVSCTLRPSMSRAAELEALRAYDGSLTSVIGCDEAGRGPLCGPVVAAAAWISPGSNIVRGVIDSKATTETQREQTFEILTNHPDVKYAVVRIEHDEIDKLNILQASLKGMKDACLNVLKQVSAFRPNIVQECMCLVDGNKVPADMPVDTRSIIKGDARIFSIAAASIIAKVSRDRIMVSYDSQYPLYGIAQHKGYPTMFHRAALKKHGPSPIHRMSYRPVYESVRAVSKVTNLKKSDDKMTKICQLKKENLKSTESIEGFATNQRVTRSMLKRTLDKTSASHAPDNNNRPKRSRKSRKKI